MYLGMLSIHDPAAEPGHLHIDIKNRKHQPISESVVKPVFLFSLQHQAGTHSNPFGNFLVSQYIDNGIPGIRNESKLKLFNNLLAGSPPLKVLPGRPTFYGII